MRTNTQALFFVLFLSLLWCAPREPPVGSPAVTARELRSHVEFLASDDLGGRATGEAGVRQAEEYIAAAFKSYGLEPLPGESDFFVDFKVYWQGYDLAQTTLTVPTEDGVLEGHPGVDFRPFDFSDGGTVTADVVFAGYGITAPEYDYDDYQGLDVAGKLVLLLRHGPNETNADSPFGGTDQTQHAYFDTKAHNARQHGAMGMLLVTDPRHHGPEENLRIHTRMTLKATSGEGREARTLPSFVAVHISQDLAGSLLQTAEAPAAARPSLLELQQAVDQGQKPAELALGGMRASLSLKRWSKPQEVEARNVVGFLRGRDPQLQDEWILVGGHHDHIGGVAGKGDRIFNGADDNASGTSGVLELAQAFASRQERPKRSLVFVTFSAEEEGLLGSRVLARQDPFLRNVGFMLNLDMIGRNPSRPVGVFGDGYARGLRPIVEAANGDLSLPIQFGGTAIASNSDHDPFFRRGVPVLFFFTGVHPDYHQVGDHADKLDYGRMEAILRLAYGVVDRVADLQTPLSFLHQVSWLGLEIQVPTDSDTPVVTAVGEGDLGQEVGFKVGDRLLKVDGKTVRPPGFIGETFRFVKAGDQITVDVERGKEKVTLKAQRPRPGFLGVVLAALDEQEQRSHSLSPGEGVRLREVIGGSPADEAGLAAGDILIRINGEEVGVSSLRRRVGQLGVGESVEVTLIRDGKRLNLPVTLGQRP